MSAPAATVHYTQAGLAVLVEGKDGHGDTCAPIAMLAYRHLAHGVPLDNITLDASRSELIGWGLMDTPGAPGMTVAAVATALGEHYSSPPLKIVDYTPTLDMQTFHDDLKNAMVAQQAVLMETANAAALPGNQAGVQYHFVLLWGIDSALGYWCANGDLQAGINAGAPTISPVWVSWGQLVASQPCGYVVLPAVTPPPPPPPDVKGALTDIQAAIVGMQSAVTGLTDAVKKLEL